MLILGNITITCRVFEKSAPPLFSEVFISEAATAYFQTSNVDPEMSTTTTTASRRRLKRAFASLSCPSSSNDDDDNDNDRPHKKLGLSLTRLSLSSTANPPEPKDIEMRVPKSYEKDSFTTVIQSLSTTSDSEDEGESAAVTDAPFPHDEAHVTIISEIEKRLTQFPHQLLSPCSSSGQPDTALVLYRSPESMGLPKLERQKQEDMKVAMRKRIQEKRRAEEKKVAKDDGYEADAEDLGDWIAPPSWHQNTLVNGFQYETFGRGFPGSQVNGFSVDVNENEDEDEGDMMDLD
jgi:hypothetical protein